MPTCKQILAILAPLLNFGSGQPSPEQNYIVLAALAFLTIAAKAWSLAKEIIMFFDERKERAAIKKKGQRKLRS